MMSGSKSTVVRVGPENSPVVCIDDFSDDPAALVALACGAAFIDAGPIYPGVRAPAPATYVENLLARADAIVQDVFGAALDPDLELCAFSMVTNPPAGLRTIQRIPHFDGPDPQRIAIIHYLCSPDHGGTSFYRHRATGLAIVTPQRVEEYRRCVTAELAQSSPAPGYIRGDSPFFERIHRVDAAFNRLVIYRGCALHSGDIGKDAVFSEDPRRGRLTINGFGFLRA
jgi:hypothetical protein